MKLKQFCLLLLFFLSFISASYAQNNLADIKVDNLTDAQVRQLMSRANAMGYQEAQLSQIVVGAAKKHKDLIFILSVCQVGTAVSIPYFP